MTLSIIVPIYNTQQYLEKCISSLYLQNLDEKDFEVLLIDDGSTDSSFAIANNWAGRKSNIRVFRQENQGQAAARNLGLDNARGQYILFVDSDDYLLPQKLGVLLRKTKERRLDAAIYCLRVQNPAGDTSTLKIPHVRYDHIYSGQEVALKFFVFGSMCRGLFSGSVFEKHKLRFRTGFAHEDSELCFRLYPLLGSVIFTEDEIYFYRYNRQSTDRSKALETLKRNIESEAMLVSKILEDVRCRTYTGTVAKRYRKVANSIMIGCFKRIRASRIWDKSEFNSKVEWMKAIGVYPLAGMTNSWKTRMVSKILNIRCFLRLYILGC